MPAALSRLAGVTAGRAPLRSRLPNPPPVFVGRVRELSLLGAALERAPVVLACGPGGIGKTSLVVKALHDQGPGTAQRAICIGVSPTDRSGEQAVHEILVALGERVGARGLGPGALQDREALLATCIDLADALDACIVIDDLHHAEAPLLEELLTCALTYARRCRFLVTSRTLPLAPALAPQTLVLGPMEPRELAALARHASPDLTEREAAAIAGEAAGSPFWLFQRLALGRSASPARGPSLVTGLAPDVAAFVLALAHLEVPLPLDALDALGVPAPPPDAIDRLVQRGLVEQGPGGVRLHGVARTALAAGDGTAVAEALARSPTPALRIEAVRLWIAAGRLDEAVRVLEGSAGEVLHAGLAPRLWQVLAEAQDTRLSADKLACAVDLGGGAAAEWALALPPPVAPRQRLDWLTVLARAGRLEEAARTAEELAARDETVAAEALLVAVRARASRGDAQHALALAESLRGAAARERRPELVALADAWAARACVMTGEHARALDLVTALGTRDSHGPAALEREIDTQRAVVFSNLGRQRSSRAALERAGANGIVSAEQLGARERLARRSNDLMETGRLAEARGLLDELAPMARRSEELFAFACMNELRLAVARGDLEGAGRHLARLEEAVRASGSGYWALWLASPRHYLGVLGALPFDAEVAASPTDFPLSRALAAWHEVASTGRADRLGREPRTDVIDAAIAQGLAHAAAALVGGEPRRSLDEAREAIAMARGEGLALWEADARVAAIEATLVGGSADLGAAVDDLDALTAGFGPSRYDAEVSWFRELARGRAKADAATFDALAASPRTGAAERRSRALLGTETRLDRVDQRIVEHARALLGLESLRRAAPSPRPGLGLDPTQGKVVLPRGRTIDLSGRPMLMRLLTALFDAGGEASKEALVEAVWGIGDYHPLRDDKRLQVAVRRLRVLLEPARGGPPIVETTEHGYRLAAGLPVYRTAAV